jgi:hypothetical protein
MIQFVTSDHIDPKRWDDAIYSSQFPSIFATYQFLSLSCKTWGALIDETYQTLIPLPYNVKFGVHYIYTPPFISRLGVFSSKSIDQQDILGMLSQIPSKFVLKELILNQCNDLDTGNLFTSYDLSLNSSFDTLYSSFSSNTKRNIKDAETKGLTYSDHVEIEEVIQLFKQNRGKELSKKIPQNHYDILITLAKLAEKNDLLDKVAVRNSQGVLIAAALFLKDQDRIWFWFSGRNNTYAEEKGMFFLINEYIKQHTNQQIILDFNGSNNPNIARFYAGFGSQKYTYPFYQSFNSFINPFIKVYKYIIK